MNFHIMKAVSFKTMIVTSTSFVQEVHERPFLAITGFRLIQQTLYCCFIEPVHKIISFLGTYIFTHKISVATVSNLFYNTLIFGQLK